MMKLIERARMGVMASAAILAGALIATPAVAAEEKTVNAFAAFVGEGGIHRTGEDKGTFVGAIAGPLYVQSKDGPRHVGRIVCPAMMQINLKTAEQGGSGQCTITATDGARLFTAWSCRGVHLLGCDGKMMITGGTGRVAGATGSGPMTVRTTDRILAKEASNNDTVMTLGRGVLILKDFKYKTPSK